MFTIKSLVKFAAFCKFEWNLLWNRVTLETILYLKSTKVEHFYTYREIYLYKGKFILKFTYIDTKHSENFRVKICHNITLSELTVDFLPLDAHLFECVSWRERINFACPQNEWSHAQQKSDRFFLFFFT